LFNKLHLLPANVYQVATLPKLSHSGYSFFQGFVLYYCITKSHSIVLLPGNNFFLLFRSSFF